MALERPDRVQVAGENRKIEYSDSIPMLGSNNGKYDFEPISVGGLEAGFYHVNAGQTTRILKIVQEVKCVERLEQGSGWFLKMNKNGIIFSFKFDTDSNTPISVVYGEGDTIVWGAKTEIRAVTFSDRPFVDEMEKSIEVNSKELPTQFWKEYRRLIKS